MLDRYLDRILATLLAPAVGWQAITIVRRAENEPAGIVAWITLAVCVIGPVLLAWGQSDRSALRSRAWLTALVYVGMLVAFQVR